MPVYIIHGFRWPRDGLSGVRVHTIVHNLEDCSAEYIQNVHSRQDLLASFRKEYPDVMKDIEVQGRSLEFIEPYDPDDVTSEAAVTQPYAYVADKVVELAGRSVVQGEVGEKEKDKLKKNGQTLSLNIEEVIADGPGLTTQAWEALADLRDKIAPGEKIGWWIVYNGDPERAYDDEEEDDGSDYDEEREEEEVVTPTAERSRSVATVSQNAPPPIQQTGPPVPPKATAAEASPIASKPLTTRSKPEAVVKPEAVLSSPKDERIPEPPRLKEVTKKSGFRSKFFGKKI